MNQCCLFQWILISILMTCVLCIPQPIQKNPENVHFYMKPGMTPGFRKLNKEENDEMQRICGISYFGPKNYHGNTFKVASAVSAIKGQFPWAIALGDKSATCTGAFISARHIVTAAHCVTHYKESKVPCVGPEVVKMPKVISHGGVCLGKGDRCSDGRDMKKANVRQVVMLRHFNDNECFDGSDLAVIELEKNVDIDAYTMPICLGYLDYNDLNVTADLGFGRISENEKSISLRYIITRARPLELDQYNKKDVIFTYSPYKNDGDDTNQPSICSGDSGGPMTTTSSKYPGRTILAGSHSFTSGCGKKDGKNGSTNILMYITFLCELTGVCPPKPKEN